MLYFIMVDDPQASERFIRIVGRRRHAPEGAAPLAEARAAMAEMARYRTRAPKGVFIYSSHEAANRDRERWIVEAIVDVHKDD
jgi:hypothetical protein